MVQVLTLETSELGDRSYIVHDNEQGVVIDPQRDYQRVLDVAKEAGVTIVAVAETHLHNDYVTGGLALARQLGVDYLVSADDDVAFERVGVSDCEELKYGSFTVEALHTPGHTPTHMSYVVKVDGDAVAIFTGGSVLYGTVGRTDLIGPSMTESLARSQFRSARRLGDLPDSVPVYPTHGFGSFCSSSQTETDHVRSLGEERRSNLVYSINDEDKFVEQLIAGLSVYPAYYAHMGGLNAQGPAAVDTSLPQSVDSSELSKRIAAGEWVVDLRSRQAFAKEHLAGTVSFELGSNFLTYMGWLIPWGSPITLIGESVEQVSKAQRDLSLIGIDRPAGHAVGTPADLSGDADIASYPVASFADLASALEKGDNLKVIDVRRAEEWEAGHIEGSLNFPIHDVPSSVDHLPFDAPLWVHCAGGFRASVAASVMDRAGRPVVFIDEPFDEASKAGLPLSR